jgi:hypothetical protein
MELREIKKNIKAILETNYGVKDVRFGRKTFDERWPKTPYMSFNLRNPVHSKNLDKLLGVFQRRVLGGRTEDITTYVSQKFISPDTSTDSYREIPIVIKEGTAAKKQQTLSEVAEEFYAALVEFTRFCSTYQKVKRARIN